MQTICKVKRYSWHEGGLMNHYFDSFSGTPFCSKAVSVGNLIFLNSLDGRALEKGSKTSKSFEEQLILCFDRIRFTLEGIGSSMNNLIKNFILLKSFEDTPRMWKTMLDYYQKYAPDLVDEPPVVTITQVGTLSEPECLVEIDAVAVVTEDAPGWGMRKFPLIHRPNISSKPEIEPGMPFLSESVVVGNLIFISAMGGENPESREIETDIFEEQWSLALGKVNAALDRAGSSMSNLVKTLHFQCRLDEMLKPSEDLYHSHSPASDRLWKTELGYFESHAPYLLDEFPGSTFLKVSSLANPSAKGQTETIGVLDRFRPGWEVKKYPTYVGRRGFPRHVGDIKKYYSNVVKVGPLLFISGQTATDVYTARIESSEFEDQMFTALQNLRDAIEETGSSLENLVKTYMLLPRPEFYSKMREIEREFYKKYAPRLIEEPPASTVIHPYNLASPSMLIEIDAIGVVPES